jgi:tRNA splicing endonuclease
MPEKILKIKVELLENFLIVWDSADGSHLYKNGYYGKPLGIAKPKIPEFDVPLILDLMEGVYLAEKGQITIFESSEKRNVGLAKLKRNNFTKNSMKNMLFIKIYGKVA